MTREMDLLSLGVVGGPWACGPRVALWRPWVRDEDLQSTCWGAHADKSRRSKDTRHASTGNGHLSTAGRGLWAGAIHVERVTINGGIATSRYRGHACCGVGPMRACLPSPQNDDTTQCRPHEYQIPPMLLSAARLYLPPPSQPPHTRAQVFLQPQHVTLP